MKINNLILLDHGLLLLNIHDNSISDILKITNLSRVYAHKVLACLVEHKLVNRNKNRTYSLTMKGIEIQKQLRVISQELNIRPYRREIN